MRIRTIKPEFWANEELAKLPYHTRLCAIGLLNYVDDEGYFLFSPAVIKGQLFPYDDSLNIHCILTELSNVQYIVVYNGTDGKKYGHVTNFTKHQRINRPTPSKIKILCGPTVDSLSTHCTLTEDSQTEREQGTGNRERKGKEQNIVAFAPNVCEIFDYWVSVTGHTRSQLDDKRNKRIRSALKLGYTVEQLKQAIDGNHRSSFHQGNNDRKMVYDSIDLIFRDADNIDKFIAIASGTGKDWKQDTMDRLSWIDEMDFGKAPEKEINPQ